MKADYNSVIYAYESNSLDILDIMSDELSIATEAEDSGVTPSGNQKPDEINASKAVSDTVKSEEKKAVDAHQRMTKILEKVKELIRKIGAIFNALMSKLKNRLRLLGETDKGFFDKYYKQKSMVKPYPNVRVESYKYDNKVIDQPITKLLGEICTCFNVMRAVEGTSNGSARISEILTASQGELLEVLFKPYVKQSDYPVDTAPLFIKYLLGNFRGKKTELVYTSSQLPQIESNAKSTKDLTTITNNYLNKARAGYDHIKSLEYQASKTSSNSDVLTMVSNNAAKAAILFNAYSAILSAYYEMKLEESLNYRIILKKFYNF